VNLTPLAGYHDCQPIDELKKTPDDPASISGRLLLHSLQAGSKDNHSAMLIQFKSGDGYEAKDEFVAGPFRPFQNDKKFVDAYLAVNNSSF
jgi:hypothetical protein